MFAMKQKQQIVTLYIIYRRENQKNKHIAATLAYYTYTTFNSKTIMSDKTRTIGHNNNNNNNLAAIAIAIF